MRKRAWCKECGCYVSLSDEGVCPQRHPTSALRWVEEVSEFASEKVMPAPPRRGLGFARRLVLVIGAALVIVALGMAWTGWNLFLGHSVHTTAGATVTVPYGWKVVSQKKTAFTLSPKGHSSVTVTFEVLRDPYELITHEMLDDDTLEAEQMTGAAPDDVTWLGLSAIQYEEHVGSRGLARTEAWDGQFTTYRADFRADGSLFDEYRSTAGEAVASIRLDR